LAAHCPKASIEDRWSTAMRYFADPALLVVGELGYLSPPGEVFWALFQVIDPRYLNTSTVIATNRTGGAWGEILGDATVAAARLDRLLHRCFVLNLDAESYRLRARHNAAEQLRKATTGVPQPATAIPAK
jgi:DNA replication protein DnaC